MINLQTDIAAALQRGTGSAVTVQWRLDRKGVATGWCQLPDPATILPVAVALSDLEARLSMVTAYLTEGAKQRGVRELAYHFDLDGATLTIHLELPLVGALIPSITPVFRNADWNEREFMELYDIQVTGHPDPRRLFLDASLESAAFERLIPYSTFSSGANGKALWDKVMAASPGPATAAADGGAGSPAQPSPAKCATSAPRQPSAAQLSVDTPAKEAP
jgi:NADH-quinone oxidoreductase subunit C